MGIVHLRLGKQCNIYIPSQFLYMSNAKVMILSSIIEYVIFLHKEVRKHGKKHWSIQAWVVCDQVKSQYLTSSGWKN